MQTRRSQNLDVRLPPIDVRAERGELADSCVTLPGAQLEIRSGLETTRVLPEIQSVDGRSLVPVVVEGTIRVASTNPLNQHVDLWVSVPEVTQPRIARARDGGRDLPVTRVGDSTFVIADVPAPAHTRGGFRIEIEGYVDPSSSRAQG